MSESPITKGNMALYHLTCALARAEGEQAETLAQAYVDLIAWVDWFMANAPTDTPESAALKCERAIQAASRIGVIERAPEAGESAAPGPRAESPAHLRTPPVAPQREADSGARVPSPGMRAAPSITRGGP